MMFLQNTFENKTALVSGGGSGIGYAIAKQLLQAGAKVYIVSRTEEKLKKAADELKEFGDCLYFAQDIRDEDSYPRLVEYVKEHGDRIDLLVNNAGGQFPSAAEAISNNGWKAVINTNLNGTFFMTRAIADAFMIPRKDGAIVNIIANIYRGFPGMAHTGAARAGVDNLTKTLAVEWAPHNIRTNAVAPGIIKSTGLNQYPPEILKGIEAKIPSKKVGSVDDVAYLTLFLLSPFASYITGETIYVDGGSRLWGDMWLVPDPK